MGNLVDSNSSVRLRVDSRYVSTELLLDKEVDSYAFARWRPIDFPYSDDDTVYTVRSVDIGRLDLLAYRFYGNPQLWWVLATANKIEDVFTEMTVGLKIRIPNAERVRSIINDAPI